MPLSLTTLAKHLADPPQWSDDLGFYALLLGVVTSLLIAIWRITEFLREAAVKGLGKWKAGFLVASILVFGVVTFLLGRRVGQ